MDDGDQDAKGAVVPLHVRVWLALAITVLWAIVNLASLASYLFATTPFEPSPWIGATMLGTAAAIFGTNFRIR